MAIEFSITNRKGITRNCLVDDIDADLLDVKWYTKTHSDNLVYLIRSIYTPKQINLRMHRVVMARILGRDLDKSELIDHRNGNGLDNTRANLRIATYSQNAANSALTQGHKTGFKGVSQDGDKFTTHIKFDGQVRYFGSFDTPEEAHEKYFEIAQRLYGEFARRK